MSAMLYSSSVEPSLPPTSPHFYGLLAALAGLVLLFVFVTHARVRARFGRKRWTIAAPLLVALVLLGWLGNGPYGTAMRGLLQSLALYELPFSDDETAAATERALDVALSSEFLDYYWRLEYGHSPGFTGEEIRARLTLRRVTHAELVLLGMQLIPAPPPGRTFFTYLYYDRGNFGLAMLGVGEKASNERFDFMQGIDLELEELVLLEFLRVADADIERLAVLSALHSWGTPKLAEWSHRALRRLREGGVSAAVGRKLDEVLTFLQEFIDDPSRRLVPASVVLEG